MTDIKKIWTTADLNGKVCNLPVPGSVLIFFEAKKSVEFSSKIFSYTKMFF